jgi:hypothetical protein
MVIGYLLLILGLSLPACAGRTTASNVEAPGKEVSAKTVLLETGAMLLQQKPPIDALNVYLDGFHFYNGRMQAQVEAHHFCSNVNEEVIQCVIFDGNTGDAKLMGVEYIISQRLFESLPPDERLLWHSHAHEVKSGQLIAPGIPSRAEHELMEKIVGTYGKTWHIWHTDLHAALPVGHPQLMMGFTADGQANAGLVEARDRRYNIQSQAKRKEREDIAAPPIALGADAWQQGDIRQLSIQSLRPNSIVAHPDGRTTPSSSHRAP